MDWIMDIINKYLPVLLFIPIAWFIDKIMKVILYPFISLGKLFLNHVYNSRIFLILITILITILMFYFTINTIMHKVEDEDKQVLGYFFSSVFYMLFLYGVSSASLDDNTKESEKNLEKK